MLHSRPLLRALAIGLTLAATAAQAAPRSAPEFGFKATDAIRTRSATAQMALSSSSPWREFTARNGGWSVMWNEVTGTPHRAFGRGIPLQGFSAEPAAADRAVRRFIAENAALLGPMPELELVRTTAAGNVVYVSYRQTLGGIPLLDTDWEFRVGRSNGKLYALGVDARHPSPELLSTPRIGVGVAREAAKTGLVFDQATDRVDQNAPLYVFPYGKNGEDYRLVYLVRVFTKNPRGNWANLVDATTGDVLWRKNLFFPTARRGMTVHRDGPMPGRPVELESGGNQINAAISGTVYGKVHVTLPTDVLQTFPLINEYIKVGATQTTTNNAGQYSATCVGTQTLQGNLEGPYCKVTRLDGGPNAAFSRSGASCGSTQDIFWDTPNSQAAERDAFFHTNRARAYIKSIEPGYTETDYQLQVQVNSVDDECSSFWDGLTSTVTYGLEGDFCPNMGTMPDIVYSEFNQRVCDDLYYSQGAALGMSNGPLLFGTSDAMASFMLGDPYVASGLEGPGTYLRNLDNLRRWPEDGSVEPAETGIILGGALWDLNQWVGTPEASSLLHFAKYGLAGEGVLEDDGQAMSEFFVDMLVADDNDADISNGTPHSDAIISTFNDHGIGTGNFITIAHTALEDQLTNGPYPITAIIQYGGPIGTLDAASPTLFYSTNNLPYTAQPMNPTGNPDEWGAEIPATAAGVVRYYISATESHGGFRIEPEGAPQHDVFVFVAGPASTLLSATMESNPNWVVTNNPSNTLGAWVRVDPNTDDQAAPEDDNTPVGTMCYVTGQALPYEDPGTADVDDGSTILTTTAFDVVAGGIQVPIISYYRWFSNNAGDNPNTDAWKVEISNNGGSNWTTVENTTETYQNWRRIVFRIRDYITPTNNMKVRFTATDDEANPSLIEAGVDDFMVLGYSYPTDVSEGAARVFALAQATPNPFRGATRLHFTLAEAGPLRLTAFDIHGRAVRTLAAGSKQAGNHSVEWDGRDNAGRAVPSGPYFLKLEQNGMKSTLAVVRVR